MNILLTSVGRRNYLVEYFKEALAPINGKVFALNSELDSPALWSADGFAQSPIIYSAEYEPFLLTYCQQHDVSVVISLFDIELPVLSRLKNKFAEKGIRIIVSDPWLTDMANDKWATYLFLQKNEFPTKQCFLTIDNFTQALNEGSANFPVFVKPRWGMGSIGLYKASTHEELLFCFKKVKIDVENSYLKHESAVDLDNCVLIQEALPGHEHGLDVINDLSGNYCTTIAKRKLAMRAGETDAAITVDEPALKSIGNKLANLTKHVGNMDVDVFFDGKTPYILEINPRFGGGYPFSHIAGVNLPKAIVNWCTNTPVDIQKDLTAAVGVKSMKGIVIIKEK